MSRIRLLKLLMALCCLIYTPVLSAQICGTCPSDPVELYLTADNLQPITGDLVCYTLRTRNFDGVTTFAFTLTFSTETLAFSSLNALVSGLPGYDNSDVSLPTVRDPDIFRTLWADDETQPTCINDDGALLELCFEVIGTTGQPLRVEIGANGFPGTGAFVQFARLDSTGISCDESDEGIVVPDSSSVPTVVGSSCDSGIEVVSFNRCGSLPGRSDGTVELQIFCGTGPYQVNVDASPAITTSDSVYLITGLRSGAHVVRVTDMSDGTSSSPLSLNVPPTPGITYFMDITQPRCAISGATPRGEIEIFGVSGGTPFEGGEYLFDWGLDRFGKSDSVRSFLPTGEYTLRLSDSLGCTVTDTFLLMAQVIEVIPTSSPARCVGVADGTISVTASGGVSNPGNGYRFWLQGTTLAGDMFNNNIQPNQSSTTTFRNIPAGTYEIWAEDDDVPSGSCVPNTQSVVVGTSQTYSTVFSLDESANCGIGQGSRNIDITRSEQGASVNYQIFRINNGVETLVVSDVTNNPNLNITTGCLQIGMYELRLQDDDGCEYVESFIIDGCTLSIDAFSTDPFCGSLGTINLITISGVEPLSYFWSNGETTQSTMDLDVGSYDVTIVDTDLCSLSLSFDLIEPAAFTTTVTAPAVTCPNELVDITVEASDEGFPPFIYEWDTTEGLVSDNQLLGVSPGTYRVTVTDDDGFGCAVTDSIFIDNLTAPNFTLTPAVAPRCEGDASGVINISIQSNSDFQPPFNFIASSGEEGTSSLTFSPANLESGEQWIVYSTTSGCSFDTVFFDVPMGEQIIIDTALSSFGQIECFGDLAIVNLVTSTGSNVTYDWPAPYNTGTGNTKIDVAAGEYVITLTSGTCISEDLITVTQPDSFGISIDPNLSSFPLCSDDLADLVTSSVGGSLPISYIWEDGDQNFVSSDFDANGLAPGTYSVTATDASGCISTDMVEITVNDPVVAFIGNPVQPFCFGDPGQIFVDSVQGGRPPYRYQLDTNPAIDINDTSEVQSGDHVISIFDLNGCSTSIDFTINTPEIVSISIAGDTDIELGRTGILTSDVVTPVGIDTIIWTTNGSDPNIDCRTSDCSEIEISPINNQTYTATITNQDNCSASTSININVIRSQRVYVPNIFNPNSVINSRHQVFQIYAGSGVESIDYLRIFDRWGNMVHEETNLTVRNDGLGSGSWDGTFRNGDSGRPLEPGVYVYVFQVRFLGEDAPEIRKGDVTLIR